MRFLLYLVLGYTEIVVSVDAVKELLNFVNRNGITLISLHVGDTAAVFRIFFREEKRLTEYFHSCNIEFIVKKRRGIPPVWQKYHHRVGLFSGLALFFLTLQIAPMFLWQINIIGLERLSSEYVLGLLEEEGVHIGTFSPSIDRDTVYANILRTSSDISWLSVNVRGSSANVEIVEREPVSAAGITMDGANIVAAKDGQILDTRITRGRRVAENGAVVQKGALLVSGVYDTAKMGTRFVCAEAVVYAQVTDLYTAEVPIENVRREYREEKTLEMSLKIFEKSINIFKNYSHTEENYDTIVRKDSLPWDGFDNLPFVLKTTVALPYAEVPVRLTETEALAKAQSEVQRQIAETDYKEILAKEETYAVEDGVLIYTCRVEAIQNIAAISEFSVD